ncbi:RNA polymerase sigma factor [Poriferisphaera sp. WC338]|uniref:RNA polymerase sigma factor n=1 Tax=Poriferisphaera sp. WC338 TaxID=3425129 RepID=UPI003D81378C
MTVLTEEIRLQDKITDEQLVADYRSGKTECFEQLLERYRLELFHFLIRFLGNRAAAEDVFQDAFLQIHLSADTFDISKRFKPWLFTIAANKARDFLRKNNRRQAASLSAMIDSSGGDSGSGRSFVDLMEADVVLPDLGAQNAEQRELVRQVVQSLPDHLREVLTLAYFNQFAYKEIAEILSIPLGTVKSRLHAAVGTFADLWKAKFKESESGG